MGKKVLSPKHEELIKGAIKDSKRRLGLGKLNQQQLAAGGTTFDCSQAQMIAGIGNDLDGDDGYE